VAESLRTNRADRPTVVDLFSGLGGLTAGLRDVGFNVVGASEVDRDSIETYRANHPDVRLLGDVRALTGPRVLAETGVSSIDVVVGCPPCQGFSRLTERHGSNDSRNSLVLHFLRLVLELRPSVCMMENVPGLLTRGAVLFRQLREGLEAAGYRLNYDVLELADYGVPQFRKRLVLMAGLGFDVGLPRATHRGPERWVTVRRAIGRLPPPPLRSEVKKGLAKVTVPWHFTRDIAPLVRERLSHAASTGGGCQQLPDTLRLACHRRRPDGFHDVYAVLDWDAPSSTITSGCTNASKGRFGHPAHPRPLTPREAAMLQTLGRHYCLRGSGVESVASQIGNALPRRFARVAGRQILRALVAGKARQQSSWVAASAAYVSPELKRTD
jgi:DNA (cytosine-5)-methyltransferase 1